MGLRSRYAAVCLIAALFLNLIPPIPLHLSVARAEAAKPPAPQLWREQEHRRTQNSRQFESGDLQKLEVSPVPLHFKDETGKWQPIDLAIAPDERGGYMARKGVAEIRFSAGEGTNAVRVNFGSGRAVGLKLDEAIPESEEETADPKRASFDAASAGNKVFFKERRGLVDYEYELSESGLKELIHLRKFTGKSEFTLPVEVEGLLLRSYAPGEYSPVEPGTEEIRGIIPAPVVYDRAGVRADSVTQDVVYTARGPEIRLSVDRAWLADPQRKYPVTIDPSVIIMPEGAGLMALSITPPDGRQVSPLFVGYNNGAPTAHALVKFDLSSIPRGAVIHAATMEFGAKPSINGFVHDVTTEWYPLAATWKSPRGQGTTWSPGGDYGATPIGNLKTDTIMPTALVQDWVNGVRPNYGVLIRTDQVGGLYLGNPVLSVTYAYDGVAPSISITGEVPTEATAAFPVSVSASDQGRPALKQVELMVDGMPVASTSDATGTLTFIVEPRRHGAGTHQVKAVAIDYAGNRAESQVLSFRAPLPEEPLNLTASGTVLTWERPVGASGVLYRLYRSTSGVFPSPEAMLIATTGGVTYTDTAPPTPRAERYYYAVATVSNGVEGRAAVTAVDYPFAPGQPQLVKQSDNSYKVSWPASSRPGVTYNLYRAAHQGFVPGPATLVRTGITATEVVDPRNMVMNGSFEGYFTSWQNSSVSIDPSEAKFGGKSVRHQWPACCSGSYARQSLTRKVSGPVTISGWSKAAGVAGSPSADYSLKATARDGYGAVWSGYASFNTGSHGWERVQFTISPPPGVEYTLEVETGLGGVHNGIAWFDGIQVEQGAEASEYTDYMDATTVAYRVTAVDQGLESSPSNEGLPVASGVLPPGLLTVLPIGEGLMNLSWQPSPTPGVTYSVHRRTCSTCQTLVVAKGLTATKFTDGVNKIPDAGFETEDYPPWSHTCGSACPTRDRVGRSGMYSIRMSQTYGGSLMKWSQSVTIDQTQAKPVTISAYGRASGVTLSAGSKFTAEVEWFDHNWVSLGSSVLSYGSGTYDWERRWATFTPPRPIWYAKVSINFSGVGNAWFDDLQLEPGTTATEWQEGITGGTLQYWVSAEKNGVSSGASITQTVGRFAGIPTPIDVAGQDLGGGYPELTWTAQPGIL